MKYFLLRVGREMYRCALCSRRNIASSLVIGTTKIILYVKFRRATLCRLRFSLHNMIVVVFRKTIAPQRLQSFLPVKTMLNNSWNPLRPKGFKVFSKCPRFLRGATNLHKVSTIERQLCDLFVPPQLFVGGLLLLSGLIGTVLTHHLSVALPDKPRPAFHAHT